MNFNVNNLTKFCNCCVFVLFILQSMAASAHSSCVWMLLLGTCVSLVVGTDCGKECALCVYRLLGQQSGFSSLVMSLHFIMIKYIYCCCFNILRDKLVIDVNEAVETAVWCLSSDHFDHKLGTKSNLERRTAVWFLFLTKLY